MDLDLLEIYKFSAMNLAQYPNFIDHFKDLR